VKWQNTAVTALTEESELRGAKPKFGFFFASDSNLTCCFYASMQKWSLAACLL
jgi:hypothetical protein